MVTIRPRGNKKSPTIVSKQQYIDFFFQIMPAKFPGKGLTAGFLVVFVGVVGWYPVWQATKGPKVRQLVQINQE